METNELPPIRKEVFSATAHEPLKKIKIQLATDMSALEDTNLLQQLSTVCQQQENVFFSNPEILAASNAIFKRQKEIEEEKAEKRDPEKSLFKAFAQYLKDEKDVSLNIAPFDSPEKSFKGENFTTNVLSIFTFNEEVHEKITTEISALFAVYIFNVEHKAQQPGRVIKEALRGAAGNVKKFFK